MLCEQVVGRALRRQSYDLNECGKFNVEYADVLGIPFDFTAKPVVVKPVPPRETIQVKAVRPERDALEIRFPRVAGYRVELPQERLKVAFNQDSVMQLTPDLVGPSITRNQGIIGEGVDLNLVHTNDLRPSTLLFHLTHRLLDTKWRDPGEEPKLYLIRAAQAHHQSSGSKAASSARAAPIPAQLMYQELADMACETHHGRHHPSGNREPAGQGGAGSLQPVRLDNPREFQYDQDQPMANRCPPLPHQLGRSR